MVVWNSNVSRSLFEQFRRLANVYFLLISVLMLIGTYGSYFDSPLDPWSTLSLLIIVLTISICKECAEDIKRHVADRQTNYRLAERLSATPNRDIDQIYWEAIKVGDLILLHNNHEIPADMIILASSDPLGQVYLETSNIDGETSLKLRNSAKTSPTTGSVWKTPKDLKWFLLLPFPPSSHHLIS
jgi:phospholipid-transporting ATPase